MREPPVGMRSKDLTAEAVVFQGDKELAIDSFELVRPEEDDLVVDVFWSGVSTGTEKLLWTGDMPTFPGFSYPLVPGYEAVGRVIACDRARRLIGRTVFVPGANCYSGARGLFGASASRIVVPMRRAVVLDGLPKIESTLLALAATAHHAVLVGGLPDLVIGHGTLGRLVARMTMALGGDAPTVWEIDPDRCDGDGYAVCHPDEDDRTNYSAICDVSGNINAIDNGIAHAARGGVLTLGGFYAERPSFAFPPAFMKEVTLKIAAEWTPEDLSSVLGLVASGALNFEGLITHIEPAAHADTAYRQAFEDPACLKMAIDWRERHDNTH